MLKKYNIANFFILKRLNTFLVINYSQIFITIHVMLGFAILISYLISVPIEDSVMGIQNQQGAITFCEGGSENQKEWVKVENDSPLDDTKKGGMTPLNSWIICGILLIILGAAINSDYVCNSFSWN